MADDDGANAASADDLDVMFLLFNSALVFFMQVGFSLLEVGAVQKKNTKNILMKNTFDASIGIVCWTLIGHGVAFGEDWYGFIGTTKYFFRTSSHRSFDAFDYAFFLFEWAFVSTSATIVSGAVAERIQFRAYILSSIFLICVVYPMTAHWIWSPDGWLSAVRDDPLFGCGVLDFAGSGVVHITGGVSALCAIIFLGPRDGVTFSESGRKQAPEGQSAIFQTLGSLILWFGWFGFNGGSMLTISGNAEVVARAMVMTAVSGGTGGVTTGVLTFLIDGQFLLGDVHNGILAGLVSITACCSVVSMEGSFVVGILAAVVYLYSSRWLEARHIDDVICATAIHAFCGCWGLLASGLFAVPGQYQSAYPKDQRFRCAGVFYGGDGHQLAANLVGIVVCWLWSGALNYVCYRVLQGYGILRVNSLSEKAGIDQIMHNEHHKNQDMEMDATMGHDMTSALDSHTHQQQGGSNLFSNRLGTVRSHPEMKQRELEDEEL